MLRPLDTVRGRHIVMHDRCEKAAGRKSFVNSSEGFCSTIELHPQFQRLSSYSPIFLAAICLLTIELRIARLKSTVEFILGGVTPVCRPIF
jgi:hypothetical protein